MANTTTQIVQIVGAETLGNVQGFNVGKGDNGEPIYYELQTQEIEFGNKAHLKNISDQIVVLTENGIDSNFSAQEEDDNFKPIPIILSDSVNIGKDVDLKGHYFTFKWYGEANETSPIFNGIYLEKVTDLGLTNE